ncbi:hypothetical protein ONS96_008538 [Cadophora gregata f. sp. sojae]|nr:hypothetical protein ONS96_008538 [Cadophora gregata f. sp. sojae]
MPPSLNKETLLNFRATILEVMFQPRRTTDYNIACRQRLKMFAYVVISFCGVLTMIAGVGFALCVSRGGVEKATAKDASAGVRSSGEGLGRVVEKRGMESPSDEELMWNMVAFGVPALVAFGARMLNRVWVLKKFHFEDYLMCLAMIFYSAVLVLINVFAHFETNLYPKEMEAQILANPVDVANRIFGSKIVVALEQCMLGVTWSVKICIWTFLLRLHRNLPRFELALWFQFAFLWAGLFTIQIIYYFGSCMPFNQYWALPVTNSECATYHNYSIVQMVFNVSSDIGLILTPIPMIWLAQLPMKGKLILMLICGLACFTVMAAVMDKYYHFTSPFTTIHQLWYIREASTSITLANLICCWQLLQKLFHLRSFSNTRFEITDDGVVSNNHGLRHRLIRLAHRARDSVSGIPGSWNASGHTGGGGGGGAFGFGYGGRDGRDGRDDVTMGTDDTEFEERKSRWDDRRRDTQFSVERDGDDARPAIMYRSMHNIA